MTDSALDVYLSSLDTRSELNARRLAELSHIPDDDPMWLLMHETQRSVREVINGANTALTNEPFAQRLSVAVATSIARDERIVTALTTAVERTHQAATRSIRSLEAALYDVARRRAAAPLASLAFCLRARTGCVRCPNLGRLSRGVRPRLRPWLSCRLLRWNSVSKESPMTPYHIRDSQRRIVARCVAIVDPLVSVVAGLWLALQLRPIAESWIQHHPLHFLAWAVALYVGVVLIAANTMMPIALLARGLGISKEVFRDVRLRPVAFWTGIALVVVSHYMLAMQWVDRQDPLPDYTGTTILTIIASSAIFLGAGDLARATFTTLREAATSSLRQAKNRSRWCNLTGQITLCGGIAKGVFRDCNLANGAPRKGEGVTLRRAHRKSWHDRNRRTGVVKNARSQRWHLRPECRLRSCPRCSDTRA